MVSQRLGRSTREVSRTTFPKVSYETEAVFRRYYLEKPSLTIIGKPSAKLASELRKQTKDRLAQRQKELGEEGLKRLQEKLDAAQQANDVEAPAEVISNFKIPDVEGIRWISVDSAAAGSNPLRFTNTIQSHVQADTSDVPYFLQFERES